MNTKGFLPFSKKAVVMKKNNPPFKFVEWSSPDELHEESLLWRSELEFSKDEQQFLNALVKNHTLDLISGDTFNKSKKVISALAKEEKEVSALVARVVKHSNGLEILVDGVDQIKEEAAYKKDHYDLKIEVSRYYENYKQTKREIFELIKQIIKQKKQKQISHE